MLRGDFCIVKKVSLWSPFLKANEEERCVKLLKLCYLNTNAKKLLCKRRNSCMGISTAGNQLCISPFPILDSLCGLGYSLFAVITIIVVAAVRRRVGVHSNGWEKQSTCAITFAYFFS